ncbi:MAG TPA: CocE/NonD family hydrolase [Gammaproteobacteria bacterium]|nr:CocE/NonD family hydrolase [Gammaproteobacteria bacterium]
MTYRVRDHLPRQVREIENVFIPLRDGCRLAARIWLPEDAAIHPVPAVLEYIPYRKRDFMRARDEPMHRYVAGHGYAAVRVDLRGSGDSDGILADEYLPQEQDDAIEVIDWLAGQHWCTGNVGMTGISWGGFNSLQVAARAPGPLKAIITLCSTDDRYADDAHYIGGCLLNENQIWGSVFFSINGLPPDPEIVGNRWRDMWLERLENNHPFAAHWLAHQKRDDYWKQGSVCEDFSKIKCAVYAVGGWADGYSNAVPRLLEGLKGPKKGLIGPWAHNFPHIGAPGPAIGYLQEALRWWDHWLKDIDSGIMDEPVLRAWMQECVDPQPFHEERPGRWVAEAAWPSHRIVPRTWHLTGAPALEDVPAGAASLEICSPQTTGSTGGDWCGLGSEGEAPMDQRPDDGRSLCFDTTPLESDLEILGAPELDLEFAVDEPVALVAARLNDVFPDGTSAQVTYGVLNLTHRESHEHPQALEPGKRYRARLKMNDIAHHFLPDHVIRLAISTCYWPMVWPPPRPVKLSIFTAGSAFKLPIRPPTDDDTTLAPFPAPEAAPASTSKMPLRPYRFIRTYERDLITNDTVYRLFSEGGDLEAGAVMHMDAINLDLGHTVERRFSIGESDPLSARAEITERLLLRRDEWRIRIHAQTRVTADTECFHVYARLDAHEGEEPVFAREWNEKIKRELV